MAADLGPVDRFDDARSASAAGTSTNAKRSSTRTLRTASPSRPAAAGDRVDEVGDLEALRAAAVDDQLGLRLGAVARDVRLGVAARGAPTTGAGATWAPSVHGAIVVLAWRSIASSSRFWRGSTKVIARPERPDAAGAADAVHVDVGRGRDVVVDDVRDRRRCRGRGRRRRWRRASARGRSLKEIITPSREPWLMSPCSALTSMPLSRSVRKSWSQRIFVRTKTIACSGRSASQHPHERVGLVAWPDLERELLDRVDRQRRRLDLHGDRVVAGSGRRGGGSRRGIVAENSAVWRPPGVRPKDPLDVLEEAEVEHLVGLVEHDDSGTTCSISEWREMRSSTRPTVPTTICPPSRSWACWVRIGAPPKTATTSMPLRAP